MLLNKSLAVIGWCWYINQSQPSFLLKWIKTASQASRLWQSILLNSVQSVSVSLFWKIKCFCQLDNKKFWIRLLPWPIELSIILIDSACALYSLCCVVGPLWQADSRLVPSQWEISLQNNAVSRWLGANLESALYDMTRTRFDKYRFSHLTHWGLVVPHSFVDLVNNTGRGNGLLPDGT